MVAPLCLLMDVGIGQGSIAVKRAKVAVEGVGRPSEGAGQPSEGAGSDRWAREDGRTHGRNGSTARNL